MSASITFPITTDGDRRNAETGVEIVRRSRGVYAVTAPQDGGGAYKIGDDLTYAEARKVATDTVEAIRLDEQQAPEAKGDGLDHARRLYPSVFAMLDKQAEAPAPAPAPEAVANVLDRVELIEFGTAEPSGYVYMLSARPGHAVCLPSMPKMEIAKRPRTRKGRNGFALAGWAVSVAGIEIDRKPTKRAARERLNTWLAEHLFKVGV